MSDFIYIKNSDTLLSHGGQKLRRAALDIIDQGILGGDPGSGTVAAVHLNRNILHVGPHQFDLDNTGRIYVIGSGKGSYPIAKALEDILGDRIHKGFLSVKKGEKRRLNTIEVMESGHPLPDKNSLEAGRRMLALADEASENDLVFLAITGGCSALSVCPPAGITLGEYQQLTDILLGSGAIIRDINTVRKHLCQLKGGRFIARIQPATAITLTLDTQPKGMLWPDMSLPDSSSFKDALDVLVHTDTWDQTPAAVKAYLKDGLDHPEWETLKSLENMKAHLISVGDQILACQSAARRAADLGFEAHILSTSIQGEAVEVGRIFAGLTREIILRNRPFRTPCALISSGEMTVTLDGQNGEGGPNQEFVLSFATEIDPLKGFACASVDTDGTDGPTDIAGGLVDDATYARAQKIGLTLSDYMKKHASAIPLKRLGGHIVTGHTGTNVLNLRVVLVE